MGGRGSRAAFVEESRFGVWFLGTRTWHVHVLKRALNDLERMLQPRAPRYPDVLDIGSGHGASLLELAARFAPRRLISVDADPAARQRAAAAIARCAVPVECHAANAADLPLADASVDLVFCHQTLHHIVAQEAALQEFFRVLRPGGVLLMGESTAAYIRSWTIRFLFRHPMEVQRTAGEYIEMVRNAGFDLRPERISLPFLWWSRRDLGVKEWIGMSVPKQREETLVNLVAFKPAA
ncbi:MAG: methyltransferase domain-containing protein [Burkholderiales bacterium]